MNTKDNIGKRLTGRLFKHGQVVTGDEWLEAGGNWSEFVELHKASSKPELYFKGNRWLTANELSYHEEPSHYRFTVDEHCGTTLENGEVHQCIICLKKHTERSLTLYPCSRECEDEIYHLLDKSECVYIKRNR